MKKLNKKADYQVGLNILAWSMLAVIIIITFIATTILLGSQGRLEVPQKLRGEIIAEQLLNNKNCLAYEDPATKREGLGKISYEKLTKETINKCTRINDQYFPAKIEVTFENIIPGKEEKDIILESKTYTYDIPKQYIIRKPVMIIKDGEEKQAYITLRVGDNAQ